MALAVGEAWFPGTRFSRSFGVRWCTVPGVVCRKFISKPAICTHTPVVVRGVACVPVGLGYSPETGNHLPHRRMTRRRWLRPTRCRPPPWPMDPTTQGLPSSLTWPPTTSFAKPSPARLLPPPSPTRRIRPRSPSHPLHPVRRRSPSSLGVVPHRHKADPTSPASRLPPSPHHPPWPPNPVGHCSSSPNHNSRQLVSHSRRGSLPHRRAARRGPSNRLHHSSLNRAPHKDSPVVLLP